MKVIDMHTHIFPENIAAKATVATAEYFDLPEPPNHYGSGSTSTGISGRKRSSSRGLSPAGHCTRSMRITGTSWPGCGSTGSLG